MQKGLKQKLSKVRLLASDFDGVMTDGYVYVNEEGIEAVRCSRRDSLGLGLLLKAGIKIIVLSKEVSAVIPARCKKINIPYYQGILTAEKKLSVLKEIMEKEKISPQEVLYVGDDINDIDVLKYVGVSFTVKDGHPLVKKVCKYQTKAKGGEHAIREICELILSAKGVSICC